MKNIAIEEIGIVKNTVFKPVDPQEFREIESIIQIHEKYSDALFRLEESEYIMIVFGFNQAKKPVRLKQTTRHGEYKGVFASRSPYRPSSIGVSTVKLKGRKGNALTVIGLDALNGTSILDIKPYSPNFDKPHNINYHKNPNNPNNQPRLNPVDFKNPRAEIIQRIKRNDKKGLLNLAGQLHGHYCPGLALGIQISTFAMREIRKFSDGIMENLLAIVEMNSCLSDGVQFVTGCTFGNNALIYRDFGMNALTLTRRDGLGLRVNVKSDWRENAHLSDEFKMLFEKVVRNRIASDEEIIKFKEVSLLESIKIVEIPYEDLLDYSTLETEIPPRAPIHDSFICSKCNESIMGSRTIRKNDSIFCLKCANAEYFELTGDGMKKIKK